MSEERKGRKASRERAKQRRILGVFHTAMREEKLKQKKAPATYIFPGRESVYRKRAHAAQRAEPHRKQPRKGTFVDGGKRNLATFIRIGKEAMGTS